VTFFHNIFFVKPEKPSYIDENDSCSQMFLSDSTLKFGFSVDASYLLSSVDWGDVLSKEALIIFCVTGSFNKGLLFNRI